MSGRTKSTHGVRELIVARNTGRGIFWAVFAFSMFVNALMLTGPIFMLQVYDRVLGSGSEATLIALFLLVAFLYLIMGALDFIRGRLLSRAGVEFHKALSNRVWTASLEYRRKSASNQINYDGQDDLDKVSRLYSSPIILALCDVPWIPIFMGAIFLFHPLMGVTALVGGGIILCLTILNQVLSRDLELSAAALTKNAAKDAEEITSQAEVLHALGMQSDLHKRWSIKSAKAIAATTRLRDRSGLFSAVTKTFRLFLQSAMLAMGAWQVLQGNMTGGAMIASSILMGRALAPIEQAVSQWTVLQSARAAWGRLDELLTKVPPASALSALPRPSSELSVTEVSVLAPGTRSPIVRNVSFKLPAGKALGLIGPSGSGKSTIARALAGIAVPAAGTVRLGGAALDQYEPDKLGQVIGYLPQRVTLFGGSIAENIARMASQFDMEDVIRAAKAAGIHQMVLQFPEGYDTQVDRDMPFLSGGQTQRIGLARALYGEPVVLILDEPNSNLDDQGSRDVNAAIEVAKARGSSVVVVAHRPSIIACCDALLHIDGGRVRAFGPRDEVLRTQVANHASINRAAPAAKVAPKDKS